jgi:hypothetical protein
MQEEFPAQRSNDRTVAFVHRIIRRELISIPPDWLESMDGIVPHPRPQRKG